MSPTANARKFVRRNIRKFTTHNCHPSYLEYSFVLQTNHGIEVVRDPAVMCFKLLHIIMVKFISAHLVVNRHHRLP